MNNKSNPGRQTPVRKKKTSPPAGRPSGRSQAVRARVKSSLQYFDYSLVASIVFLVCFGLVMLYSASAYAAQVDYGNSMHYFYPAGAVLPGGRAGGLRGVPHRLPCVGEACEEDLLFLPSL